MTIKELGNIIREIRTQKLKMSQTTLAQEVGVQQMSISRLERGEGCTLELFLRLFDYFKDRKIRFQKIFSDNFNIDRIFEITTNSHESITREQRIEQIQELINEIENSHSEDLLKIRQLINSIYN